MCKGCGVCCVIVLGDFRWQSDGLALLLSSDWQPVMYLRDNALQRGDQMFSSPLLSY